MKTKMIIAAAAATFAGSTLAADQGFYMGGNVGATKADVGGAGEIKDTPTTWGVYGGYDFTRHFAVEVGYQDLGSAKAGGLEVKSDAVAVDLVGRYPLTERFGLYGKVGLAYMQRDLTGGGYDEGRSGTAAKMGFGGEFKATQNIGIRAEIAHYTGGPDFDAPAARFDGKQTLFTMGVNYRF